MADIKAKEVAELRKKTGAGMMECKKALTETNGDMEAAVDLLRKKGSAKADKRADRTYDFLKNIKYFDRWHMTSVRGGGVTFFWDLPVFTGIHPSVFRQKTGF